MRTEAGVTMWRDLDSRSPGTTLHVREPFVVLFLAFVTLGVYYPAILTDFCIMDDMRAVLGMLNFSQDYTKLVGIGDSTIYRRPLNQLVFYGVYLISGDQALLFHLINVLFHLGCGLVIYHLVRRTLGPGPRASWPALIAALIFLLHPLNVEAAAWVSGRCAVISTFFALLAVYLHLTAEAADTSRRLWLASGCYLLSLLFYEVTAALPLAFIVWDVFRKDNEPWRIAIRRYYKRWVPYGVLLFAYLVCWGIDQWLTMAQTVVPRGSSPTVDLPFLAAVVASPFVGVGFYVKKMIFPWPLNFHISTVAKVPYFFLGVGFLVLLSIGLRRRVWWASWGWAFLFSLLPILSLTVYARSWTALAERYAYLASSFFSIAIGLLLAQLVPARQGFLGYTVKVLPFVVLLVFGYGTADRLLVWQDEERLFADTVEKSPEDGWVAYAYAQALHRAGKVEEAERYLKRAYDLGFVVESALILGQIEESKRNFKEAERYYLKAAWPSSDLTKMSRDFSPGPYQALANLHWKWGKTDPERATHHHERVVHFFKRAYEFSREDPFILYNLGKFHLEQGDLTEAKECFRKVYETVPDTYYGKAAGKLMKIP
jgi:protein O-mannosyl-transferase